MGERYTRLFTLPKNCYVPGAPVLVEAGALLKDNAENKVIAQLKILNLQNKALKAVTVAFLPFDTTGKVLGKDFDYQYLDLNTKKNQTFGERTPVEFPDATTRAFLPAVMEVIFEDNSQWKVAPDEVWNPLPKQEPLDSALSNPILKLQYQKETTSEAAFRPEDLGEIWRCTCGAVNPSSNGNCRVCQVSKEIIFSKFDIERLKKECDNQKEIEQQSAILKKKRNRKIALGGGILTGVLIVALFIKFVILPIVQTSQKYNTALKYASEGQYSQAISLFEELGSYKESEENLQNCRIAALYENEDYIQAAMLIIEKFTDTSIQNVSQDLIDLLTVCLSYQFADFLENNNCGTIYKIEYYNSNTALVYCSNMATDTITMGSDLAGESTIWMIGTTPAEKENSLLIAEGDLVSTINFDIDGQGKLIISSIE